MATQPLEQKLETWKRGLMLCLGFSIPLLFLALTEGPYEHLSQTWGWYVLWMLGQILITPLGFILLVTKTWQELPLSQRLNTAFGYLSIAWVLLVTFVIKTNQDQPGMYGGLATLLLYTIIASAGAAIGLSYLLLRRAQTHSAEEMFP